MSRRTVSREAVHVVGAGVSGLTCGIVLQEAGYDVRILASERAENTVSRVAAALWLPYRAEPPERVFGWAARSFDVFRELARDPSTGVRMVPGVQVGAEAGAHEWHRVEGAQVRPARADELPPGHTEGIAFVAPVCEMSIYLEYLARRFDSAGGQIEVRRLEEIEQAFDGARIVVNACGLGARELVGDRDMFAIRGQVVGIARDGLDRVLLDERDQDAIAYVVPRSGDVILGGSAEVGREDLEPDPEQTRAVLQRCTVLEPRAAGLEVREVRVGLRPGRSAVRLEAEARPRGELLVHDYGHGGAGVTLSWGCAAEVLALVRGT